MPITSHNIETSIQPDGRINYVLRLYDQEGTEKFTQGGLLPAGFDTAALVSARIIDADIRLAEEEFNALVN